MRLPPKTLIWAQQRGCGSSYFSRSTEVVPYPEKTLRPVTLITVSGVYGGDRWLKPSGLVIGAKAYVVVDQGQGWSRYTSSGRMYTSEVDVMTETMVMDLNAPLLAGSTVAVIQYLCDASDASIPKGVFVTRTEIHISTTLPGGVLPRGATYRFTVHCTDAAGTGRQDNPEWGSIVIENLPKIKCGEVFEALYIAADDERDAIEIWIEGTEANEPDSVVVPIVD